MYCDLLIIGTRGHPSPLRHADVLIGWSLKGFGAFENYCLAQFKLLKKNYFFAGRRQCQLNGEAKTVKTNTAHDRSGKSGAGSSSKNIFRIGLHAPEPEISNVHSEPAMNRKSVNVHFNAAQGMYLGTLHMHTTCS